MKNSDCGAFPSSPSVFPEEFGLTKREYFAAMAMQGLLSADDDGFVSFDECARVAVKQADALLKALEENK